jgi:hypothetical protein
MARDDLPQNQIIPAARPVDAFIRPAQQSIAAPASPQLMPNPSGIRMVAQGNGGNVAGFNQFEQLAQALAPFSKELMQLAGNGVQLYATTEYEKGRSEAMRAAVLANQQMLASGAQYAAENRKLDKVDPVAALMMDRVNPFRQGGRENAFTRIAGQEILPAVTRAVAAIPNGHELKPEDPVIKQTTAQAVTGVLQRYGLNEGSAGFIENVLPHIGQAEQRAYERQLDAHVKHLKEVSWRQAVVEVSAMYQRARELGQVEWTEYNPVTGQPIRKVASYAKDRAAWERGVQVLTGQIADRLANETGITGETDELKRKMFVRLAEMATASGNTELARVLLRTEVGPVDKNGRRALAGEYYGIEIFEETNKIAQTQWQAKQREADQGVQNFESELASVTYGTFDGPERGAAIDQLVKKYQAQGVPLGRLMEATKSMSSTLDDVAGRSYNPSSMDALLQDMQERVGTQWNARDADQQFERTLPTVAPKDRSEARNRYAEIRRRQEKEQDDVPSALVDPLIAAAMKSRLRWAYSTDVTEASLRGADISAMLAWGDADVARSSQLQLSAYRKHIYARLREAEAKKKAKLDAAEITEVANRALEEYGKNNKEEFNRLFPGSGETGTPSVGGRARPPRAGGAKPTGDSAKPSVPAPTVYPSGQLDNIPDRRQALQEGRPVLALPSIQEEIARIYNGQSPSAAVMRAARDAGYGNKVGQWLLREAGNYEGYRLDPRLRQKLLRSSNDAAGAAGAFQTAAAPPRPVESTANWWFNALTGSMPASAATFNPAMGGGRYGAAPFTGRAMASAGSRPFSPVLALLRSGEGGWDSANRGIAGDTPRGIPGLSSMTLAQWKSYQRQGYNALGAYQFIPRTLELAAREAGISDRTVMTPAVQDRLAVQLMIGSKRRALAAYLRGHGNNIEAALDDLALEWASVATRGGGTAYPNQGGNRASIGRDRARRALQQAKAAFLRTGA